ncbi:hypothetical protein LAZ40_09395 [Cereibacter sphaeroides]|uniref:hypothetical protein n=1 Tax=Cereibacter sphaeroides TaxID=1063 RepID=UPI001F3E1475|nr:hypothetical protein [Cereibacter sphaeroides]MCE6959266.1 hypothetical protein [Cereibacter sphaeroides]MCE6972858.1 hypothetical protein [Cereibacter sphaeroides]
MSEQCRSRSLREVVELYGDPARLPDPGRRYDAAGADRLAREFDADEDPDVVARSNRIAMRARALALGPEAAESYRARRGLDALRLAMILQVAMRTRGLSPQAFATWCFDVFLKDLPDTTILMLAFPMRGGLAEEIVTLEPARRTALHDELFRRVGSPRAFRALVTEFAACNPLFREYPLPEGSRD